MNAQSSIMAEEALDAGSLEEGKPFDPDGVREERLLRVLERLTELGMMQAERLTAQVMASDDSAAGAADIAEAAAAFAKVSRSVRLTVMLEAKVAKDRRLRLAGVAEADKAGRLARLEAEWALDADGDEARVVRRQRAIADAVRDVIRAERPEGFERELLFDRLERLWADDFNADLSAKPDLYLDVGGDDALISEQVAAHCKALGLKPDWGVWKDSFWAVEEAEDVAKGSPYARTDSS
jgi:hypothetical protein